MYVLYGVHTYTQEKAHANAGTSQLVRVDPFLGNFFGGSGSLLFYLSLFSFSLLLFSVISGFQVVLFFFDEIDKSHPV